MTPSAPTPSSAGATAVIDRWVAPSRFPATVQELRRARIVVVGGWLGLAAYATLTAALLAGKAPLLPLVSVAASVGAAGLALALVRRGGRIEPAAWLLCCSLVLTPVAQAAVDLGIRDPALALIILAPIGGALMSGARLALVASVIGITGAAVLFALDALGLAPVPFSTSAEAASYALATVTAGCVLAATTGILYVQHSRSHLSAAEGQSQRLDAALRASEQRYRSLFDHVPVGMFRTAPDGRILLANAALARMIGAPSPEAARAHSAIDIYADPTDRDRLRDVLARDGSVRKFETRWRRPDGTVRHVRLDSRVARGADGEPLFYEGAVEDITAEREARLALRHSEARFRALVQRSSDVVVVADAADHLTYVSPAIRSLLGMSARAAVGVPFLDLVHEDDQPAGMAFLAAAHRGEPPAQFQLRLCHADGHDVFVEGAATALYDDPAVSGLVLNLRDATERRRAEAVLVQAKQQAEEVAALKSSFLANMSHEIRTPLTAIIGFADVLGEEVTDETQSEFVDLIARSGRRLMDTLNSVLDLTRLDADDTRSGVAAVDAAKLARETVEMFGPAAAEAGLGLGVSAPASLEALADEASLGRVLHNLIGNAIKFTDAGRVTLEVREADGQVAVVVRDTGIGIDPAFLPRVFGEFEQESTGHGRRYEGVGLGLALSRQLVERMGGTISVESTKGVGTAFTVTLPSGAPSDDTERPLVLVVDDNDQARHVAAHSLARRYRVVQASDGDEALAAVERERPDAAVLDIHLGASISGEDVMRRLRGSESFADLPMIAVTAYGLPGDKERFLAAGFDAYLTKPYTREALLDCIGHALGGPPQDGAWIARPAEPAAVATARVAT